jgi:hypothetical protein
LAAENLRNMKERRSDWQARLMPYVRFGLTAGALALAKRSVARWVQWGTLVFFEQQLVTSSADIEADVQIREIREKDLPALATAFRRNLADLRARVARGDRAFCAFAQSRGATPLHMRWATSAPTEIPEAGLWLCAGPGEVYVYDAVTHPLFRGRRLSGAVRVVMDNALVDTGLTHKLAYVRGDNHSMHRSLVGAPAPFRELFQIHYVRGMGRAPLVFGRYRPPVYDSLRPALFAKAIALG